MVEKYVCAFFLKLKDFIPWRKIARAQIDGNSRLKVFMPSRQLASGMQHGHWARFEQHSHLGITDDRQEKKKMQKMVID